MRHLHCVLFTLVAASSCADAPTAVRLHVEADPALELTGLSVSAGAGEPVLGALAFTPEVLVLVPDGWADHQQPFAIDGTTGGAVVAHGDVDVVPRRAEEVSATVILVSTACPEVCEVGARRCGGETVERCELDDDLCPAWTEAEVCGGATPFCAAGTCVAHCQDDCTAGDTTCDGSTGERVCGQHDGDECLEWGPTSACALDEVCAGDACTAARVLTVAKAGSGGGTVRSVPGGIDCGTDCAEAYPTGATVQLMAIPIAGATFRGWSGAGCAGNGGCTVSLNATVTVTATFDGACADECSAGATSCASGSAERVCDDHDADACLEWGPAVACGAGEQCLIDACAPVQSLTVTTSGSGAGSVTSSPGGIDCGADCTQAYATGTMVQLTATPAAGTTFGGWMGGGCAGTGACTVTLAAATTVDARFVAAFTGQLAAGYIYTARLRPDHTLVEWGAMPGQLPAGSFDRLASGLGLDGGVCALRTAGHTLACWGATEIASPPSGSFRDVDVGDYHACAIDDSGDVTCWGDSTFGQTSPPAVVFRSVTAGGYHSCGVALSGAVRCWGRNDRGQTDAPADTFVAVSAGYRYTCAITAAGTLRCWGNDEHGETSPPSGTFVQVSSGDFHGCAIRSEGTLACWGEDDQNQATPPAGTFVDVAAGNRHTCATRTDGVVLCWGANDSGQSTPP